MIFLGRAIYHHFASPTLPFIAHFDIHLAVTTFIYAGITLLEWFSERRNYTTYENIFTLLILSLLLSMNYGSFEYFIYANNNNQYQVNNSFVQYRAIVNQEDSIALIKENDDLVLVTNLLVDSSNNNLKQKNRSAFFKFFARYDNFYTLNDSIKLLSNRRTTTGGEVQVTYPEFTLDLAGRKTDFGVNISRDSSSYFTSLLWAIVKEPSVRSNYIELLSFEVDRNIRESRHTLTRAKKLPLKYFILSRVESITGGGTKYYTAYGGQAVFMNFIFNFFKFMFFGFFIKVFSENRKRG